jgi:hypothetical protein
MCGKEKGLIVQITSTIRTNNSSVYLNESLARRRILNRTKLNDPTRIAVYNRRREP